MSRTVAVLRNPYVFSASTTQREFNPSYVTMDILCGSRNGGTV